MDICKYGYLDIWIYVNMDIGIYARTQRECIDVSVFRRAWMPDCVPEPVRIRTYVCMYFGSLDILRVARLLGA